jgi:hypothetical protein
MKVLYEDDAINKFQIHSTEVEEILTSPPSILLSSGNYIVLAGVLLLLITAYLIPFPDVIITQGTITTNEAPYKIYSQSSGTLQYLNENIGKDSPIDSGAILAVIAHNEDYNKIMQLLYKVESIATYGSLFLPADSFTIENIGLMSSEVARLKSLLKQYRTLVYELTIENEIQQYRKQITTNNEVLNSLIHERTFAEEQLRLIRINLDRQSSLAEEKVVSSLELERVQLEFAHQEAEIARINRQIQEANSLSQSLERQIISLVSSDLRSSSDIQFSIDQSVDQLLSLLEIWKTEHVLTAPTTGICTPIEVLQENQFIADQQELFYISPNTANYHIQGILPFEKSGSVTVGQRVIVKMIQFPYREYGTLTGEIAYVAYTPGETGYYFTATLTQGAISSYGKELHFKPLMPATLEVILEENSLLERVFYEVKNLFM